MTPFHSTAIALTAMALAVPALADLPVHVYSSPDPDSTNTFAVETGAGLVVISTQRTFSQAERAIARIERTGRDFVAIVVPVPHTDHFGGLGVFRAAFPEATVYAAEETIESMRTDSGGYIASRGEALGADFPTQAEVDASLPDSLLEDGQVLEIGDVRFEVIEVPNANAPMNTLLHVPEENILFGVEVVEDGVTAFLRTADLDAWLISLDRIEADLPGLGLVYVAHNAAVPAGYAFAQQRAHLTAYRDAIAEALADDGAMSDAEREASVARIEAAFPDHSRVALVERADLVGLNLDWQTSK